MANDSIIHGMKKHWFFNNLDGNKSCIKVFIFRGHSKNDTSHFLVIFLWGKWGISLYLGLFYLGHTDKCLFLLCFSAVSFHWQCTYTEPHYVQVLFRFHNILLKAYWNNTSKNNPFVSIYVSDRLWHLESLLSPRACFCIFWYV